ncbi:DUF7260 family protein [Salinigranum halophilum]|uniref:DUF7260 family protein n=1 Tax=Salinigranum halophilum TaxID=2565931 RepID=UPI0010A86698|nr:hypothetical protein [Salinigranum halophilum]
MCTLHTTILANAQALAKSEEQQLSAEIVAFERFVRLVRDLDSTGGRSPVDRRHPLAIRTGPVTGRDTCFREIRSAYRRTILAVPHWKEAYGEPTVAESLANEFSRELAELVLNPGPQSEPHLLQSRLVEESQRSIEVRERTRARVREERKELQRLDAALDSVRELIDKVQSYRGSDTERLSQARDAQARLEHLLETHQSYLNRQPRRCYETLVMSLYANHEVNQYPGLVAIARTLDRLQQAEVDLWTEYSDSFH